MLLWKERPYAKSGLSVYTQCQALKKQAATDLVPLHR